MAENEAALVDSSAEQVQDGAAEQPAQPTPKWTDEKVDQYVKSRIDKQNAKHATELDGLNARIKELEELNASATAERDELKRKNQLAEWAEQASAESGVPASIIRGTTLEEMQAHAASLKEFSQTSSKYPVIHDSGEPKKQAASSTKQLFADFMKDNF